MRDRELGTIKLKDASDINYIVSCFLILLRLCRICAAHSHLVPPVCPARSCDAKKICEENLCRSCAPFVPACFLAALVPFHDGTCADNYVRTSLTPRNFWFHALGHFLNRPGTTIHSLDLLRCSSILRNFGSLRVWYLGVVLNEYHPGHFDSLLFRDKIKIRVLIDKEAIEVLDDKKSILEVSQSAYIQKFPEDAPRHYKKHLLDFHRRKFARICRTFMKTPGPDQYTTYHLDKYSYDHRSALFQLISNQLGGGSYHNQNVHFYRGKHVYWVYGMTRKEREVFGLVIHRLDYDDNNSLIVESSWKDRMRIRVRNRVGRVFRCWRKEDSEDDVQLVAPEFSDDEVNVILF